MTTHEFGFTVGVTGFHIYRRVWLPHLGQHLSIEGEIILRLLFDNTVTLKLMRMLTIDCLIAQ